MKRPGKLLLSWGGPGTDPGEFNIAPNDSCSFTFTVPGTYEYFCSLHPPTNQWRTGQNSRPAGHSRKSAASA
jgi:hypothetical protein